MQKKHSVFFYCLLELKNLSDSKLVEGTAETVNKKRRKLHGPGKSSVVCAANTFNFA